LRSFSRFLLNFIDEFHNSLDQRQEGGVIQPPLAMVGHVEQFECHKQPLGSRTCALAHAEGYAAFFMRASDPQLSVIARRLPQSRPIPRPHHPTPGCLNTSQSETKILRIIAQESKAASWMTKFPK
jgi:hypothetical protein